MTAVESRCKRPTSGTNPGKPGPGDVQLSSGSRRGCTYVQSAVRGVGAALGLSWKMVCGDDDDGDSEEAFGVSVELKWFAHLLPAFLPTSTFDY